MPYQLKKVRYTHDACIDAIIADPGVSQGAVAALFGLSETWLSQILNCDAFQARLAQRKSELVDPQLVLKIEERLRGLAQRSMDKLFEKLEGSPSDRLVLGALELSTKGLGLGAPKAPAVNLYVVQVPQKSVSSEVWAERYEAPPLEAAIPAIGPPPPLAKREPLVVGSPVEGRCGRALDVLAEAFGPV